MRAAAALGLALAAAFVEYGSSAPGLPPASPNLVVVPSVETVAVGDRLRLRAYVRRSDGSLRDVNGSVKWSSSTPSVVRVAHDGVATGRRAGSAPVLARTRGRTARVRLIVTAKRRALRVSRVNSRYFQDAAARIVYLAGADTWTDLQDSGPTNPPARFDYGRYLAFLQAHDLNTTILYAWEQARWTAETRGDWWFDPTVYVRTGPGVGRDGRPRFDLTRFNSVYFARLRRRVVEARERGIYTIVMLFNGWSLERKGPARNNPWPGHPYNARNNINAIDGDREGVDGGAATHTLSESRVTALQDAYVRHVIEAVGDQPNVLYEVSNESDVGSIAWQNHVADVIARVERDRPLQHPIGITSEWPGGRNADLLASHAEWIAPNGPADNPTPADGRKVIVADTDHLCGVCGDASFPWKALTRGLNPLFMDIYDGRAVGLGARDADPRNPDFEPLRRALGATRVVAQRVALGRLVPRGDLASSRFCLADPRPGGSYLVYRPAGHAVTVDLSRTPGALRAEWIRPDTGDIVRTQSVSGGGRRRLTTHFSGPAVLLLRAR